MGSGLRLTYLGHATVMIELDGVRLLTDPVLGRRLGPLRRLGPTPDPAAIGPVDGVLISHGHPDHFNGASLRAIAGAPALVVPRGMGPHACHATARDVREVRVNERVDFGPVRVTAVPARHRRWPRHRDARPIGYLIEGSTRVYFAGDTALYPGMAGLAGRVDVALLPVGRWGAPRGPARLGPTTAVEAADARRRDGSRSRSTGAPCTSRASRPADGAGARSMPATRSRPRRPVGHPTWTFACSDPESRPISIPGTPRHRAEAVAGSARATASTRRRTVDARGDGRVQEIPHPRPRRRSPRAVCPRDPPWTRASGRGRPVAHRGPRPGDGSDGHPLPARTAAATGPVASHSARGLPRRGDVQAVPGRLGALLGRSAAASATQCILYTGWSARQTC